MTKNCINCKKEFKTKPSHFNRRKFCSYKCYWTLKLGTKRDIVAIEKFKVSMKGMFLNENNPMWKGDKVSYKGLHRWIRSKLGDSKKCEFCGKEGNSRQVQWANKSRQYKRDLTDWMPLCILCHRIYDAHPNFVK